MAYVDKTAILKNINLSFFKGDLIGIVGLNGVGKSISKNGEIYNGEWLDNMRHG